MKRKMMTAALTAAMALSMGVTAFAGQWTLDNQVWRWTDDDGTSPKNEWRWLDGNQDGIAECYYFDGEGTLAVNQETPDHYMVNNDGAWVVNGVVQTQVMEKESDEDDWNYDRESLTGYYYNEDGEGLEIYVGQEDGLVGWYYDEDGDLEKIYTFKKVNDVTYRDANGSRTIKLQTDGGILMNDEVYYR